MQEFLCFTNFGLIFLIVMAFLWVRGRLKRTDQRVTQLEAEVNTWRRSAVNPEPPLTTTQGPQVTIDQPILARPAPPSTPTQQEALRPVLPVVTSSRVDAIEQERSTDAIYETKPSAPLRPPFWQGNPLIEWFTRIHIMVQIGLLVLFFGIGFLVKYAVDSGWFPLELRLASAAAVGVAVAAVGWRVRTKQRTYGLALIGGGIGIVYLTTYGAYALYHFISSPLAFVIFTLLAILYAMMSLLNNAPILALMAIVGAFLSPILASGDGGSHITLFSYYVVVNAGILAIAWYKSWHRLNSVGFGFTLLAGASWGIISYQPALFASTEPFLLLFFGFYLAISLLYARRQRDKQTGIFDILLLYANPVASFSLQAVMLREQSNWLALSALGLALIYGVVAWLWSNRWRVTTLLSDSAIFLATFFLAISIPLRFDGNVTPAIWALLAVGVALLAQRRQRLWLSGWAVIIEIAAGLRFWGTLFESEQLFDLPPFTNHLYVSALILSFCALVVAYLLQRQSEKLDKVAMLLGSVPLFSGFGWWFAAGIFQIVAYFDGPQVLPYVLLLIAVSCALFDWSGRGLRWKQVRLPVYTLLPSAALLAGLQWVNDQPFLAHWGWLAWLITLAVHLGMLTTSLIRTGTTADKTPRLGESLLPLYHAGGGWLFTALLTGIGLDWVESWFVGTRILTTFPTWQAVIGLLIPTTVLLVIAPLNRHMPWPISTYPKLYGVVTAIPLVVALIFGSLFVNLNVAGDGFSLPYLPFLNLLDATMIGMMFVMGWWVRWLLQRQGGVYNHLLRVAIWVVGILAFVLANFGAARGVHHLTSTPYELAALFESSTMQATLALFWGVLALALMFTAHRRGRNGGWQPVWYSGAAILGLTVLKLFLVDLAQTGTVARIISFISVGLLIIVIAYFWPVPPSKPVEA